MTAETIFRIDSVTFRRQFIVAIWIDTCQQVDGMTKKKKKKRIQ